MKKMLSIFALVVVFTACKNKTNETTNKNMVLVDTTGLSKSNVLTDVGNNKYVINDKVAIKPVSSNPLPSSSNSTVSNPGSAGSSNNNTVAEAPVKKDKGWSDAAKGTAIGAGSGAVLGAVVAKGDRGKGAVIGSVIGAGTGYLIGRSRDKKSGRVARARARKAANN
jgi:YMGG-like Gly-zipper